MKKLRLIWHRLRIAWAVLFSGKHFTIIWVKEKEMINVLLEKPFAVDMTFFGMEYYVSMYVIKGVGQSIDDTDFLLMRASFEADAEAQGIDMDHIGKLREEGRSN